MKKLYLIISCALLAAQPVWAQLKQVSPESEGFSSERLKRIDTMLHSFTDDHHKVAGVVAIVSRNGKIVYYSAAGYNDIGHRRLMRKDDLFRIASQTKAITGVAVMMLYEEGKILLDDPISKYIPEFRHPKVLKTFNEKDSSYTTVSADREVTIRDLLTHTSGISYPVIGTKEADAIYAKAGIPTGFEPRHILLADEMKKLATLPLMHQPGAAWTYGLNIDMLGYLVEIVSHKSLKDFFQQRIFDPLGMKDTYFYVPAEKQSRLAKVYTVNKEGETVEDHAHDSSGINTFYPLTKNGSYYSGGAGLSSTAYDYAVFLQMLENGGIYNRHRLLSPSTVRMMTVNQIGGLSFNDLGDKFGLTFEVTTEQGSSRFPWNPGSFSWGGFWGSSYWVDPKAGIVAQIWTQEPAGATFEMENKFKNMVYSAIMK